MLKKPSPHIAIFDLYRGGHHPQYIRQLMTFWVERELQGRLDVVVTDAFMGAHPDVVEYACTHFQSGIRMVSSGSDTRIRITDAPLGLIQNDREHGRVLRRYLDAQRPDHCVILYFDHVQFSLAFGLRFDFPLGLSGIYFRPSFHYDHFGVPVQGLRPRLRRMRKQLVLGRALANPHFQCLFSLDPYAVPHIRKLQKHGDAVPLPDGVPETPLEDAKGYTGDDGRKRALLFGAIDRRKGVLEVLEAVRLLTSEEQAQLTVQLVGVVADAEHEAIVQAVELTRTTTKTEVQLDNRFVSDEEILCLIRKAGIVLVTYQHHIGSSGVLIRTAMERRPVLGSNYGLVGAQIRDHRLGFAVDTTSPRAIADTFSRYLRAGTGDAFDPLTARGFAEANTADRFCETIFSHAGALVPVASGARHAG